MPPCVFPERAIAHHLGDRPMSALSVSVCTNTPATRRVVKHLAHKNERVRGRNAIAEQLAEMDEEIHATLAEEQARLDEERALDEEYYGWLQAEDYDPDEATYARSRMRESVFDCGGAEAGCAYCIEVASGVLDIPDDYGF